MFLTALVSSAAVIATVSSEHLTGMTHTDSGPGQTLDEVENWIYEEDSASSSVPMDKNSFFIKNKQGPKDMLAIQNDIAVMFDSHGQYEAHEIWTLEGSTLYPGFYYIHNAKFSKYRLASHDSSSVKGTNGYVGKGELWRFQKEGDYYLIFNKENPTAKLSNSLLLQSSSVTRDDQLWKLIPRFTATVVKDTILTHHHNTGNAYKSIAATVRNGLEMKYTHSGALHAKSGFKDALKSVVPTTKFSDGHLIDAYSIAVANKAIEESLQMPFSGNAYMLTTQKKFRIPPGKKIQVTQLKISFKEPGGSHLDSCTLYCPVRILYS